MTAGPSGVDTLLAAAESMQKDLIEKDRVEGISGKDEPITMQMIISIGTRESSFPAAMVITMSVDKPQRVLDEVRQLALTMISLSLLP